MGRAARVVAPRRMGRRRRRAEAPPVASGERGRPCVGRPSEHGDRAGVASGRIARRRGVLFRSRGMGCRDRHACGDAAVEDVADLVGLVSGRPLGGRRHAGAERADLGAPVPSRRRVGDVRLRDQGARAGMASWRALSRHRRRRADHGVGLRGQGPGRKHTADPGGPRRTGDGARLPAHRASARERRAGRLRAALERREVEHPGSRAQPCAGSKPATRSPRSGGRRTASASPSVAATAPSPSAKRRSERRPSGRDRAPDLARSATGPSGHR